ncbi:alpha/beta fold hydrolase [Nodosilinea sp. LEGE 07088]|uniref:alpha/beta fold hydrolase n=1 Tax=Nodosilinea sp. LEGE 07088 TaxID=2777968 RepID=UPI00187F4028|nr:alpha/beta fold hydrolase [Nodosilinea sp. LEGE 07088]MBE9139636.1 alpha/beta fold hydrolase [Nodosilinea sp. LEGE 07088]
MLIPPGFIQRSVALGPGTVVYVEADPDFWPGAPTASVPLLFVHGFGGGSSSYEWSKVYPAFAADHPVLAPDLIGWGQSDHPDQPLTTADYEALLIEVLQTLCPVPPVVVASSLSAAMMVRVAIAQPGLVRSLVLVAPAGLADFGQDPSSSVINQMVKLPLVDQVLYRGAIATAEGIKLFLAQRQFADSSKIADEMVAAYLASAQQPHADVAALAFVRGDLSFDLAVDLPQLTTPTVVLWGEAAQLTGVDIGHRLVALNPSAIRRFEVLPGVGLTPQLEVPGVTVGLIQQSLAALATANRPA